MWNRPTVDFIQSQSLPWIPVGAGELGAGGGLQRVLSRDPEDGAQTVVLQFRSPQRGVLTAGADLYVLEGDGRLNGRRLGPGHYVHVQPGAVVEIEPGLPRTVLYVGYFGDPQLLETPGDRDGVTHVDTEALAWTSPEWSGEVPLEPGVMVKWLRRDAGGIVYLSAMVPGWKSEPEEAHPVYEEAFKLFGDMMQGARGVVRPGGYFFRPPDVFHGPLYTRTGTMSLIRSDRPTTTVYRDPPPDGRWRELAARAYGDFPPPAV